VNESITVFILPGSAQSTMTTQALLDARIPFVVIDLATDEGAFDVVQQLGYESVPVVVVGGASWSGFRPDRIRDVAAARASEQYLVPIDPMDELGCESCQ
jgi:glutaredoxin-like protein NrdH